MTSRRTPGLTPDDLNALSAGLDAGKRVTVYLRDPMPSLGLDAGASARVLSIDGTTVTVRPKGVDDQLPFEADELRRTRAEATPATPARKQAATKPTGSAQSGSAMPRTSRTAESSPAAPQQLRPTHKPANGDETNTVTPKPAATKAQRRPKTSTASVSVTVTSAGESTWTVSVAHGSKKIGKPTEVTADRVARAMRELDDPAAIAAVDEVIESARAAAQKRIEELSSELEAARAALAHLDVQNP